VSLILLFVISCSGWGAQEIIYSVVNVQHTFVPVSYWCYRYAGLSKLITRIVHDPSRKPGDDH
jgi:hypothetical protein